jgi:hypothetical protein
VELRPVSVRSGWGFATVTVAKGSNVWASASLIDVKTNDPLTIPAKQ